MGAEAEERGDGQTALEYYRDKFRRSSTISMRHMSPILWPGWPAEPRQPGK